jgi:hypothetical protein
VGSKTVYRLVRQLRRPGPREDLVEQIAELSDRATGLAVFSAVLKADAHRYGPSSPARLILVPVQVKA